MHYIVLPPWSLPPGTPLHIITFTIKPAKHPHHTARSVLGTIGLHQQGSIFWGRAKDSGFAVYSFPNTMPGGRPAKRPGDGLDSPLDTSSGSSKTKLPRLERGPEDFSSVVKSKLQSYSRTGQACDRCKVCILPLLLLALLLYLSQNYVSRLDPRGEVWWFITQARNTKSITLCHPQYTFL